MPIRRNLLDWGRGFLRGPRLLEISYGLLTDKTIYNSTKCMSSLNVSISFGDLCRDSRLIRQLVRVHVTTFQCFSFYLLCR